MSGARCSLPADLSSQLQSLTAAVEEVGDDVEDLEDEVEDIADDVEDELEDFKEGIEAELEAVGQQVVSLREEVKSLKSHLETGLQDLERKVVSSIADIREQLVGSRQEMGKLLQYLPSSCAEKLALNPDSSTGYYWIRGAYVYCDMARKSCSCGSSRGWMRVAHLDMAVPSQQCPSGFRLRTSPRRMCARTSAPGCTSVTFPAHGVQYSRVCGRVRGYQHTSPDAFYSQQPIDSAYVDGISITHGQSPRKHIWTFAAAADETRPDQYRCPCSYTARSYTGRIPLFVGNDYFCDSGSQSLWGHNLYIYDPLWDGEGCGPTSSCCQFNAPPWFCKELPHTTTDNIEVRVCSDQDLADEDTPIDLIELYVQ